MTDLPVPLPLPLALEPIVALLEWPDDELTEAQFLTEVLDRTGATLLHRVRATQEALLRKRAGEVGTRWATLRGQFGPQWTAAFAACHRPAGRSDALNQRLGLR